LVGYASGIDKKRYLLEKEHPQNIVSVFPF